MMIKLRKYCSLILAVLIAGCSAHQGRVVEGYGISASNGMVVSAHKEASIAGIEILRKGGNAVDAAVATGFALAVCYPEAGNIGGGGFMLISMADGRHEVIDYREKAPLSARRDMFLDSQGNYLEGSSTATHLASGVPGSVDGLIEAHKKYGRLPFKEIIQPAIELAEKGFRLSPFQASSLNYAREGFIARNRKRPSLAGDTIWKEGDMLKQPDLATTLKLIRDNGRDGFYSGKVALMIVNEMKRGNGLISNEDLTRYHSVWRKPLEGNYKGYKILTAPPPSGGGIILLQLLKMIEDHDLKSSAFHSTESVHLIVEAEKRAYADRSFFSGDPDFISMPVDKLLDKSYLDKRMSDFNTEKATPSSQINHGTPGQAESEETTHYSVTDSEGNAVSTTTTLNGTFGNSIVVEGAGFLLNNEMDDFSVKPGIPNMYGLTGGEANSIVPGKRMLSSMTPSVILKDDRIFLVTGSPGGATIPTTVFQVVSNVIDYGMTIQGAVDAARFHHQWLPDIIFAEKGSVDSAAASALNTMGYQLKIRGQIGSANSIVRLNNGTFQAGADRRGNNSAAGY